MYTFTDWLAAIILAVLFFAGIRPVFDCAHQLWRYMDIRRRAR